MSKKIQVIGNLVGGGEIPDSSITTDKIADSAVTNSKISNGSITPDKLSESYATEEYVNDAIDGIAASGGQVQADYAETDNTKVSYIKNKPVIDFEAVEGSTNLITSGVVYDIKSEADNNASQIEELKAQSDNFATKEDIEGVKSDLESAQNDIESVKTDVESVQEDITSVKSDIELVEGDIVQIQEENSIMKTGISDIQVDMDDIRSNIKELQDESNIISVENLPVVDRNNDIVALTLDNDVPFDRVEIEVKTREDLLSVDENGVTSVNFDDVKCVNNVKIHTLPDIYENDNELWVIYNNWHTEKPKFGLGIYDESYVNGVKILFTETTDGNDVPYITLTNIIDGAESVIYYLPVNFSIIAPEITQSGWYKLVDGAYTKLTDEELSVFNKEFASACVIDYWATEDEDSYNEALADNYFISVPLAVGPFIGKFVTIQKTKGFYKSVNFKWSKWNDSSDAFSGSYNDLTDKPEIPSVDGFATKDYVDSAVDSVKIPTLLSELKDDSAHRLVTDTEKAYWNEKSDFSGVYNDLIDKPFGETYKFDDVDIIIETTDNMITTNSLSVENQELFLVKIGELEGNLSDEYISYISDIVVSNGQTISIDDSACQLQSDGGAVVVNGFTYVAAVDTDNVTINNFVFPEAGIYILVVRENESSFFYVSHIAFNPTISKIDAKYIPDTYADKNYVIDSINNIEHPEGAYIGKQGVHTVSGNPLESAEVFNDYTNNTAGGFYSHAEGSYTTAIGDGSHAEGSHTTAIGDGSHAEGGGTTASGEYSHAEGYSTTAIGENQHVQGRYNIIDNENKFAHIVGNGDNNPRYDPEVGWITTNYSNAHTLDWDGNGWFAGDVYVHDLDENGEYVTKLATEDYVNDKLDGIAASGGQVQADYSETDETKVSYIKNKPTVDTHPAEGSTNLISSGAVFEAIDNIGIGEITNGSITTEKLATSSVTTEKIANGSITGEKLSPEGYPQSDYTENDGTSLAHIKNRPFYEGLCYGGNLSVSGFTVGNDMHFNYHKIADLETDAVSTIYSVSQIYNNGDYYETTPPNVSADKRTVYIAFSISVDSNLSFIGEVQVPIRLVAIDKEGQYTSLAYNQITINEPGLYLILDSERPLGEFNSVEVNCNITFKPFVKTLDSKFLPEEPFDELTKKIETNTTKLEEHSSDIDNLNFEWRDFIDVWFWDFVTVVNGDSAYDGMDLTALATEIENQLQLYVTEEYVDEKIEEISSLGGQVQSDYAETDSTKVTYIKNKPLVDSQVTEGSTKLITSGAVFKAISEIDIPDIDIKVPTKLSELEDDSEHRLVTDAEKEAWNAKSEKGEDGISATHEWNGTILTITSASGTSSADLKGNTGEQGIQGEKGEQGIQGEKGADGYTPVKGTDYFTEEDKQEIVDDVIAELPEYATKDEVNQLLDSFAALLDSANREVL